MEELRAHMRTAGIDVALITDDDAVYYLTGYYDYLHMEFGRPTILVFFGEDPFGFRSERVSAMFH